MIKQDRDKPMKKVKELKIIRGNDTLFSGNPAIPIKINTKADLTGFTASLFFGSVTKSFPSDDVGKKKLSLSYTSEETSSFFPGRGFATLKLYDTEGRQATVWRFVFNVVFPYEHNVCGKHGIEVVIGDADPNAEVKYDEENEMLVVSFDVAGVGNGSINPFGI